MAWYEDGLNFTCTQCGNCCTGGPGVVWVDSAEIRLIAEFLSMHPDDLWGPILRRVGAKVSLTERGRRHDCVFLRTTAEGTRTCSIYSVRPQQCRTWPFWSINLRSRSAWDEASERMPCPGMNSGLKYEYVQIEAIRTADPWHRQRPGGRHEAIAPQ